MTIEGGIDVSVFQGTVNWGAVAAAGVPFAIAKATEGVGFTDRQWPANAAALSAPGPVVPGAYHFGRPDLGNSPEAEANWFVSKVRDFVTSSLRLPTGVLLALDLEVSTALGDLSGWRDAFCLAVESAVGAPCGWYTFWNFALQHGLNAPSSHWAWLAWPDENGPPPPAAFSITFQQYGQGAVPGIPDSPTDLDRFFGDRAALLELAHGAPIAVPIGAAPSDGGTMIGASFRPGGDQGTPTAPKGYRLDMAWLVPSPGGKPGQFNVKHSSADTTHPITAMTFEDLGGFFDPRFGVQCYWDDQGIGLHIQATGVDGLVRLLTEFWPGMAIDRSCDASGWCLLRTNDGKPVAPAPPR